MYIILSTYKVSRIASFNHIRYYFLILLFLIFGNYSYCSWLDALTSVYFFVSKILSSFCGIYCRFIRTKEFSDLCLSVDNFNWNDVAGCILYGSFYPANNRCYDKISIIYDSGDSIGTMSNMQVDSFYIYVLHVMSINNHYSIISKDIIWSFYLKC